jgi:hypothetical protein
MSSPNVTLYAANHRAVWLETRTLARLANTTLSEYVALALNNFNEQMRQTSFIVDNLDDEWSAVYERLPRFA